jgi:hypothetical protein
MVPISEDVMKEMVPYKLHSSDSAIGYSTELTGTRPGNLPASLGRALNFAFRRYPVRIATKPPNNWLGFSKE